MWSRSDTAVPFFPGGADDCDEGRKEGAGRIRSLLECRLAVDWCLRPRTATL